MLDLLNLLRDLLPEWAVHHILLSLLDSGHVLLLELLNVLLEGLHGGHYLFSGLRDSLADFLRLSTNRLSHGSVPEVHDVVAHVLGVKLSTVLHVLNGICDDWHSLVVPLDGTTNVPRKVALDILIGRKLGKGDA